MAQMNGPGARNALFSYGFRPFFLAAGLVALAYIPWWVGNLVFGWPLATDWPPMLWHGHEMLFGFVGAGLAGFLLTAVPSWTGERGFAGAPLIALASLWLAARLAIVGSAVLPALLVSALDLAFLPLLALYLSRPLWRARNRNTPLLVLLAALIACNATFHRGLLGHDAPLAGRALSAGIDVLLLLVTVIGGRIVPAFTAAGLRQSGSAVEMRSSRALTVAAIGAMLANLLVDLVAPGAGAAAAIALLAALVQAARLAQWCPLRSIHQPLLWVLHLAYGWLPLGLALKALAMLAGPAAAAFWQHALTIGVLATMILAVMSRATLGHTGRALVAEPLIALAYGLLALAALVRVFGLGLLGMRYPAVLLASALLWTAAFALYLWVYAPMLVAPRVDGRPG